MRLGADVEQLEDLAARMATGAEGVASVRSSVQSLLYAAWWSGANADQFRSAWARTHAPALDLVAQVLVAQGQHLTTQALQQRQASESFGPGGTGPGGPGTPVGPSAPIPGMPVPSGPSPVLPDQRSPAADPVDTFTGALYRVDVDLPLFDPRPGWATSALGAATGLPLAVGIGLERWYHSGRDDVGLFGRGWTSILEVRVEVDGDRAVLVVEDGTAVTFTHDDDAWVPDPGVRAELLETDDGWLAVLATGRLLDLDPQGRLRGLVDTNLVGPDELTREAERTSEQRLDPAAGSQSVDRDDERVAGTAGLLRHHVLVRRDVAGVPTELVLADGSAVDLEVEGGLVRSVRHGDVAVTYGHDGDTLTTVELPGRTGHYAHDDGGRLATVHRDDVLLVSSTYDDAGRVVAQVDVDGGDWAFDYDGPTTRVTRPDGAVESMTYDDQGRLAATVGPRGTGSLTRDGEARIVAVDGDRSFGLASLDGRDVTRRDGREVLTVRTDDDAVDLVDDLGRGWRLEVDGSTTTARRLDDPEGRALVSMAVDDTEATVTSPAGAVRITSDERGRLRSMEGPEGRHDVEWSAEGGGDGADDADGGDDEVPRRVVETAWTGLVTTTDIRPVTSTEEAPAGALALTTSRGGRDLVTQVVSRSLAVLERTRGDGRHWTWQRDVLDRITSAGAPGGRTADWDHGLHGPWRRRGPDGTLTIDYEPTGDPVALATPDGRRLELDWDDGMVVRRGNGAEDVHLDRDERGHVVAMRGREVDATWTLDELGRRVAGHDRAGEVRWELDDLGRVVGIERPGHAPVTYERDARGRVTGIAVDDVRVDVAGSGSGGTGTHDGPGGPIHGRRDGFELTVDLPNGLRVDEVEDPAGWVGTRRASSGDRALFDERVVRNDGLQLEATTVELDGQRVATRIARDDRGWVTGAQVGDAVFDYDHDDAGRRLAWSDPAGDHRVALDHAGRPTEVRGPDGVRGIRHDAAGRVVADGDWTYDYDANGGLLRATDGTTTQRHVLDGSGRRVRSTTTVDGTVTRDCRWTWDLSHEVPRIAAAHDDVTGRREVVRWGSDGTPLAVVDPDDGGRSRWLVTDHLGSVRVVVGADGDVLRRRTFGPFGEVVTDDGTEDGLVVFGFVGSVEDVATGQLHLQARQYDPTMGRFTAPDPVQAPIGEVPMDPWVYCFNQPTELHDPTGAWPGFIEKAASKVGDVVEGAADAVVDVAGDVKGVIDDHVPIVGDAIDWVGEHRNEIMTGLAIVGTVAAIAVTGGAAAGVLVPAWVGTVGTVATVGGMGLAAVDLVDHASEREWGGAAFDLANIGLGAAGLRLGNTSNALLQPFRNARPVLSRATMGAALTSSDDVARSFLNNFVHQAWYSWPVGLLGGVFSPERSPQT